MAFDRNEYGGITLPPGFNELPPGAQQRALEYALRRLREGTAEEEEPAEAQPSPPPDPEPPESGLPPRSARKATAPGKPQGWGARVLNAFVAVLVFVGILGVFLGIMFGYARIQQTRRDRYFAEVERRAHAATAALATTAPGSPPQPVQPSPSPPSQAQQPRPTVFWVPGDMMNLELVQGQTEQLQAWVQYEDGTRQDVTGSASYTSGNPAVATVTPGGLITAVSPGQAFVSVTYNHPKLYQNLTVTVNVLSSQANQPAETDWDELAKRVAPYVFRIQSSDGSAIGTAFYTGDNWRAVKEAENTGWAGSGSSVTWIYTAAHVVQGHEDCEFEFQRVWKGKVEREWAEAYKEGANPDFTALATKWDGRGFLEHSPEEYFENAPLFGNGYALTQGETVLIVGNPRNLWQWDPRSPGPIATLGKVLAVDVATRGDDGSLLGTVHKHLLKLEAETDPGSSGSPVFNSRGEVVGMVIAESVERIPGSDLNRHVIWAVAFPIRK